MPSLNEFVRFFLRVMRVCVYLRCSFSLSNDSLLFGFNLCEHMKHSSRVILRSDVNERTNEWLRLLILEHDQMWFLHPPTEYTNKNTEKNSRITLTQRARFVRVACHLIFKGAISMMDESFYCMTSKSHTHMCVCFVSVCCMHTLKSFVFFCLFVLKMLILISNFTWFAANFDSHAHSTSQTRTSNKCNDEVFSRCTQLEPKKRARNANSSWYAVCLTPIRRRFTFRIDFNCHVNWSMEFNAWIFFYSESPKIKIITYYREQNVCVLCMWRNIFLCCEYFLLLCQFFLHSVLLYADRRTKTKKFIVASSHLSHWRMRSNKIARANFRLQLPASFQQ